MLVWRVHDHANGMRRLGYKTSQPNEDTMPLRRREDCKIIQDYKGFRSRQSLDSDSYQNAYYICDDGEERCVGQTNDIVKTAEGYLRKPLPTWMTKKPIAWSPYSDQKHIASTCCHGVALTAMCDTCIESYGEARCQ